MAKKIGAIISLSIIGILIVLTIVMASVNVNHRIYCAKPQYVYVYSGGVANGASQEQSNTIVEFIDNASKENCLSAFFGGNLDATADVVAEKGTVKLSSESYYVSYIYTAEQELTEGKKAYKDGDGNTYKFEELLFEVSNTEGVQTVKVYIIADAEGGLKYTHYYNLQADFGDLYNYIKAEF